MRRSYGWRMLSVAWRRWGAPARRVGLGIWVLRVFLLTPSPLAADQAPSVAQSQQDLRVQDVLIEGKLYSPQALFILSRPAEQFGTEAVLPHYLSRSATTLLVPYQVRGDVFSAALTQALVASRDSTGASFDSRRSQ